MYTYKIGKYDEAEYLTSDVEYSLEQFNEIVNELCDDWTTITDEPDLHEICMMWFDRGVYSYIGYIKWILINKKGFSELKLQAWY